MRSFLIGVKNVLLWSYERGSWQYDLLCLLIAAAVFLVPSRFFGDRDRNQAPTASVETKLAATEGTREEVLAAEKLQSYLESQGKSWATAGAPDEVIVRFLHDRCHCEVALVKPSIVKSDANGRVTYHVWFREK
jgi:membrane protein implicated in regulation of membrane protease activity